jgi:hypothetical protein
MNDLERDLTQLFHEKADTITTAPRAPETLLRRGRRHQVATVLAGTLAGAALIVVVIGVGSGLCETAPTDSQSTQGRRRPTRSGPRRSKASR